MSDGGDYYGARYPETVDRAQLVFLTRAANDARRRSAKRWSPLWGVSLAWITERAIARGGMPWAQERAARRAR